MMIFPLLCGMGFVIGALAYISAEDDYNLNQDTEDIVGYWRFDEGSGVTVSDASGHGNIGTVYGASWVDGTSGAALSFDGSDDFVEVPYSSSLDFEALTWSAWVKLDAFRIEGCGVVSKAWTVDYAGEWSGSIRPDGRIGFTILTDSGRVDLAGSTVLSPGTWYHVAGTYDGSVMRVYVNGVEDGNASHSGSLHLDMPLRIGRAGRVGFMDGVIDEVRVYNRALTPAEIRELAVGSLPDGLLLITSIAVGAVVLIALLAILCFRRGRK